MKLSQLFSIFAHLHWGESANLDVSGVFSDSRKVKKGGVFVATRGETVDSHKFLAQVVDAGAVALVVEKTELVPEGYSGAVLKVENGRVALNQLASRFYGNPSEKLFTVGVTGTNGKSSIVFMVEAILNQFGWKTGVIGTIDHHMGEHKWKTELTTPDALTFHKRMAEFQSLGAKACCLEVSSIALAQTRIGSVSFDAVVFTNLTRDHLDYHKTMPEYFAAKSRLFNEILSASNKRAKFAIVNVDDPYGHDMQVFEGARHWAYGRSDADLSFQIVAQSFQSTKVKVITPRGEGYLNLSMPGLHNVYNAVAAIGVGLAAGVSLEKCLTALENLPGVPGRLEAIPNTRGLNIFVDYAHTDDALANVLSVLRTVREVSGEGGRIFTLFGCGGDRDNGKRPLMGEVAWKLSDIVFVTSDNPRSEDPQQIIDQILAGVGDRDGQRLFVEIDRRKAIERALRMANQNDVILVAGKGHEDYQILAGETVHFSDVEVVTELLNEMD